MVAVVPNLLDLMDVVHQAFQTVTQLYDSCREEVWCISDSAGCRTVSLKQVLQGE